MSLTGKSYFMGSGPRDVCEARELREAAVETVLSYLGVVHPVVRTEVEILVDVYLAAGEYTGPSPKGIATTRNQLRAFIMAAEGGDPHQIQEQADELWNNAAINIPLQNIGFPFSWIERLTFDPQLGWVEGWAESDIAEPELAAGITQEALRAAKAMLAAIPRQKLRWPRGDKPFDDLILGLAAHFEQQTGMPARDGIKKREALYRDVWDGPFFALVCDLCYALDLPTDPDHSENDHASLGKRIVRILATAETE